jgi:hypothetical protein
VAAAVDHADIAIIYGDRDWVRGENKVTSLLFRPGDFEFSIAVRGDSLIQLTGERWAIRKLA